MEQEISPEHVTKVLEQVTQTASMSGYEIERVPESNFLALGFDMGGGRKQVVYIRYVGQTPDEQDVVAFDSPCLALKKGWLSGMGKNQALDLLRRNAELLFGHFALETVGDGAEEVLVVTSSQIVQTMEIEEFEAHLRAVAFIADEYEKEMGQDNF